METGILKTRGIFRCKARNVKEARMNFDSFLSIFKKMTRFEVEKMKSLSDERFDVFFKLNLEAKLEIKPEDYLKQIGFPYGVMFYEADYI